MIHVLLATFVLAGASVDSSPGVAASSAPVALAQDAKPASTFDHTHAAWTAILSAHVAKGRVDYAALKKEPAALAAYLKSLEAVKPAEFAAWKREQQLAFWINAYNAYTIRRMLESYPFGGSTKVNELGADKKGPWSERTIPLAALAPSLNVEKLSLDDLENRIIRPTFKDARIHAAVNCAAVSCPPLRNEAYSAEKLDKQLDEQVRAWLADPALNQFDAESKQLRVSHIFEWYADDFIGAGDSIPGWIGRYSGKSAKWISTPDVKLLYLDYDWSLNDKRRD